MPAFLSFYISHVEYLLEEQERRGGCLEVSRIHWAAQDVGGFPGGDASWLSVAV
jgi:hypothetical protein